MNQPQQQISNNRRTHDFNMEHFRIRLTARLCIILVCLVQYIPRIPTIVADPGSLSNVKLFAILSLPFPILMILTIMFEYFLYKKLGPGIVKYSWLVDLMLLAFFIADWILVVISYVNRIQQTDPTSFSVGALYGFTTFSWRTLMVTLIVQKWQLKIIAPVVAICVATGYAIHYTTGTILYLMLAAGTQLFNVIIIIYCEDKVKWRMVWANIQQEKWMQVNNFILNSIPENIMILDIAGEVKFISEYCKAFIKKCHLEVNDTKDFFRKVRDLQQQYESNPSSPSASLIHIERLTAVNGLPGDTDNNNNNNRNDHLEDLITNFKNIILTKEIQERQFLVYNAKLKMENHKDKSLEIKISFVQHFENYHIVLIIRDTTQRDMLIALEETNKYKDQLLASVSHELRAPLNGNINLVESAVQSKKIPDTVKETLLIPALRSSKFLLHIINDILDMSQIKEKRLRLIFQSDNLKETLKSTAQLVELQAKKKGIELVLDLDPSLPRRFCTDHIRLSQIVLNLLNNAIKFTKKGQVKLTAKTMLQNPTCVKITIEDSGIGMSQDNVQKLFSSYTHIEFEGRQVMNPTGVGLGLNIAYNLADLLAPKGQQGIHVSSVPNQGSSFTFVLENKEKVPIELEDLKGLERSRSGSCEVAEELPESIHPVLFTKTDSANSLVPIVEKSNSEGKNKCTCSRILIVDDNPFNTMAFETILGSLEVKCDSVYSGSACIKSLLNRQTKPCGDNCKQYAVIFMDQEMPEMSGVDTVNEIIMLQGQNLLSTDIKVIGCTAHKSKEEVDKFLEAGIVQCIHKPISVGMIKDILKRNIDEI